MANGKNPWSAFWDQRETGDRAKKVERLKKEEAAFQKAEAAKPSKYSDSAFTMPSLGNLFDNIKYGAKAYIPGTDENKQYVDSIKSLMGDAQKRGTVSNRQAQISGQANLGPAPITPEAGDYVDGADYDKWSQDFGPEDSVDVVNGDPRAPVPAPRARAQRDVPLPQRGMPAPEPGLAYGRGMSHGNRLDFLNNPNGYNAQVDIDRAAGRAPSPKTQYVPNRQVQEDAMRLFNDSGAGYEW